MSETRKFKSSVLEKLDLLGKKYEAMGQDLDSYLEGLLHADYLTYWDYINLDTLLSLQQPRTSFPDEGVFIIYHQVTELYFKLALHELSLLHEIQSPSGKQLLQCVTRVNRYFKILTDSFDVMIDGMERDQFLKFRMSLLPSSGFQSGQYRFIEVACTSFDRLMHADKREEGKGYARGDIAGMYDELYWRRGAVELASGKSTLTLLQFEDKYQEQIVELAEERHSTNLNTLIEGLPEGERSPELIAALRMLDAQINVNWPLAHYRSAVKYLQRNPEDIAATGGTNWQKYLPPRFQKCIFFPSLWSKEEQDEWGKAWVNEQLAL
jgi:tryptophan 2,3-dioxygenase